jgi:hypothetical protein
MDRQEVPEHMYQFGLALQRLASIRSQIEPKIPNKLPVAQQLSIEYKNNPSLSSLSLLSVMGKEWNQVVEDYAKGIEACKARLPAISIPESEKQILLNGYEAMSMHTLDVGEQLGKCMKIQASSEFSEGQTDMFAEWIPGKATSIYQELKESSEEKGGLVFYQKPAFDIRFIPNQSKAVLAEAIEGYRSGDPQAVQYFFQMAFDSIRDAMVKAYMSFPTDDVEAMFDPIGKDLKELAQGTLTRELESYLSRLFADSYTHDPEPVFSDDTLFEGSGKRFFAHFHHHRDLPDIHYLNDYRGPADDDIANTWKIGPQVLFAPKNGQLEVYFMSRGNSQQVGSYPI